MDENEERVHATGPTIGAKRPERLGKLTTMQAYDW